MAALSATAALLFPAAASAEIDHHWIPSIGMFVGYAFGATRGVEWGFEVHQTYRLQGQDCASEARSGAGGLIRFATIGLDTPFLTLAVLGGSEISREAPALSGELGATFALSHGGGVGIHTGFDAELQYAHAYFRNQWLLGQAGVGAGARALPLYGTTSTCEVTYGRPLRSELGAVRIRENARRATTAHLSPIARHAGSAHHAETARRAEFARNEATELAAREWERDAQYECASIPAFLQLAEELLANDAPDALVERALDAANDEIRHAHLCAEMATRLGGEHLSPALPAASRRVPLVGEPGLIRLAQENWMDGCLSEGAAAKRAARAAACAHDRRARAVQASIAVDEKRHAELGWSVLRWASGRGGDAVRDAVRVLRDMDLAENAAQIDDGAVPYGRLGAAECRQVDASHVEQSRQRLDACL